MADGRKTYEEITYKNVNTAARRIARSRFFTAISEAGFLPVVVYEATGENDLPLFRGEVAEL